MKTHKLFLPLALVTLTSCGPISEMNCMVNSVTDAIHCNRQAVEWSTQQIRENQKTISGSTETIGENHRQLMLMEN